MRYGNEVQLEGFSQRQSAGSHIYLYELVSLPGSLYVLLLDACILQRFLECVHDEVFSAHIPALAEAGAAHSYNSDFIFYAFRHVSPRSFLSCRPGFPEIAHHAAQLVNVFAAQYHFQRHARFYRAHLAIGKVEWEPAANFELHHAIDQRRVDTPGGMVLGKAE